MWGGGRGPGPGRGLGPGPGPGPGPGRGLGRGPGRGRGLRGAARPPGAGAASGAGLEWGRVGVQVAAFCETAAAAEWVAQGGGLVPAGTPREAEALLDETAGALAVLDELGGGREGAPAEYGPRQPLIAGRVPDVRPLLRKCRGRGPTLTAKQLDGLARALEGTREVAAQLRGSAVGGLGDDLVLGPELAPLLELLRSALAPGGSALRSDASAELSRIRGAQREVGARLEAELLAEGRRLAAEGALEGEPLVYHLQGRACLAVLRGRQGLAGPGKRILGESNSGGTFYVEPAAVVGANDEALLLRAQEAEEEELLLRELSDSCRSAEPDMQRLLRAVGRLDAAFARARHAQWIGGRRPAFTAGCSERRGEGVSGELDLLVDIGGLKHPVLVEAAASEGLPARVPPTTAKDWEAGFSEPSSQGARAGQALRRSRGAVAAEPSGGKPSPPVVGVDFKVERGTRGVAVTGPNTGGKTAALKALGLAALMARAGLYLPSAGPARLPFFDKVLADIGDGQSLEQNLSTFSGHIQSVRGILSDAGPDSLVLLDEVGSGTDPAEGAALAVAILRRLAREGAAGLVFCTTHHSEVKELVAEDPSFEGAAAEFDAGTLRPTYRLLWGESGESSALDIAERLGFADDVVEVARRALARERGAADGDPEASSVAGDIDAQLEEAELQLARAREATAQARERLADLRGSLEEAEAGRAAQSAQLNAEAWRAAEAAEARIAAATEGAAAGALAVPEAERAVQATVSQAEALFRAAERRRVEAAGAGGEGAAGEGVARDRDGEAVPARGAGGAWLRVGAPVRIMKLGGAAGTVVELRGGSALVRSSAGLEVVAALTELREPL